MSTKSGPTRIPVFGSRIQQELVRHPPVHADVAGVPLLSDVGKKVRVAERDGVLRFIGDVHFAAGVWCGVELSSAVGKNDGDVRGVRYFSCPPSCGLMAPLSKVTLVENDYEEISDEISGPHSILFGVDKEPINNYTFTDHGTTIRLNNQDDVHNKTLTLEHNLIDEGQAQDITLVIRPQLEPVNNDRTKTLGLISSEIFGKSNEKLNQIENETFNVFHDPFELYSNKSGSVESLQNLTLTELNFRRSYLNQTVTKGCDAPLNFRYHQSTPVSSEINRTVSVPSNFNVPFDDEASKRDSLEFEESLGILTPEQMIDATYFLSTNCSRTPSSENIRSLPMDINLKPTDLPSPSVVDASLQEFSLGIIDENVFSNLRLDSLVNMELPLEDYVKANTTLTRLDQTPSPEDLPLDPTPVVETQSSKTTTSKSQTNSSFIASITSITSLDTGYQGDGEMSRPASRGADNSPMTRRPLPRPQPRRPDPMTDSDFYTESDADNHEDHPLRGDRRAQVIDGTLYGVDPQATADIYVNNRENMDSSGIFTDIENNTLSSADNDNDNAKNIIDASPSDTSSKTISDNSQFISNNTHTLENSKSPTQESSKSTDTKRAPTPSSIISSPSSVRSPRHVSKNETTIKKYKMPKRNVVSKVKAMMGPVGQENNNEVKKPIRPTKTVGRWDAVMNKISKNPDESKTKLKEVKSKVFNTSPSAGAKVGEARKITTRQAMNQKSPNVKPHRTRHRLAASSPPTKSTVESLHSSMSDLSGASPAKKSTGSAKKREVVRVNQVNQVLTAAKLSPRSPTQHPEIKKNAFTLPADAKLPKRTLLSSAKDKKQVPTKESSRGTVKGGRASPSARPPIQNRATIKPIPAPVPRTTEALAVLVQHLVFNLEAFRVPYLRRDAEKSRVEAEKMRQDAEDARMMCQRLGKSISEERIKQASAVEEERVHFRAEITELLEQHRKQMEQYKNQITEAERQKFEVENSMRQLQKNHEETLGKMKLEFNKLQRTHEEALDILREENDAIREDIDEKNERIKEFRSEKEKWQKQYEAKEIHYKEQLRIAQEEIGRLKEEKSEIFSSCKKGGGNVSIHELDSLRAVLELKQKDYGDLRRAYVDTLEKAESVPGLEEKVSALTARCEDLELQLERKSDYTRLVLSEKQKLEESFREECNQRKKVLQHNEELQWRLKHNQEVVSQVLEQAEEGSFNRSLLSSSFNERHLMKPGLERSLSYRERTFSNKSTSSDGFSRSRKSKNSTDLDFEDGSPPSSPKVKGIVEKSDSVSYVLDLDESPEVVASRIVRRSFRNTTPPKNTPTKSPANKRPRMKSNPLSQSAPASSIVSNKPEYVRSRSVSVRNGESDSASSNSDEFYMWATPLSSTPTVKLAEERSKERKLDVHLDLYEEEDDIDIPALPSEIGRKNSAEALPIMVVSASNSDDESTSSSSVQL